MMLLDVLKGRTHTLSQLFFAALAGLLFAGGAMAQNLGTTFTDLWYTPGEDGWGVNIDHQQNVMFLTFFIYRADRSPYWVTAVLTKVGTGGLANPPQVFTGDVFEDHGPWFGDPFNPATVVETTVGTATFTAPTLLTANLQYSINGVTVTKNMQRLTLSTINYSADYYGVISYTLSNCQNPAQNGTSILDKGGMLVSQFGTSFQLILQGQLATCNFAGTYRQSGSIGQVDGNYACTDGTGNTFSISEMQWTLWGITGAINGDNRFCRLSGFFGGITGQHRASTMTNGALFSGSLGQAGQAGLPCV